MSLAIEFMKYPALKIKSTQIFNFLKICALWHILLYAAMPAKALQLPSSRYLMEEIRSNFNRPDSVFLDLKKKYNSPIKMTMN